MLGGIVRGRIVVFGLKWGGDVAVHGPGSGDGFEVEALVGKEVQHDAFVLTLDDERAELVYMDVQVLVI